MVFGRKAEVHPGQFYRKVDSTGYVFEVVDLKTDPLGAVHVYLRRHDEPATRRTLALSILTDPDFFELMVEPPPPVRR